jgi:NAD(P)-dependent dehydrogenase (short-subunit alcohol dehydrogenase family)
VRVLQASEKALKAAPGSAVVLFSTVAVQTGMPFHASVAMAKGAVEGLTRSLAAEWAPSVRVNALAPSLTDTPLAARLLGSDERRQAGADRHPLKSLGRPEDLASTALFLLSDEARWITGQVWGVDGGMGALRTQG